MPNSKLGPTQRLADRDGISDEGVTRIAKTASKIFRLLWILFCIATGALLGALVLSGTLSSTPIAAVIGGVIGGLFGWFVPLFDALEAWFD